MRHGDSRLVRIAVFASGAGSTFRHLVESSKMGELPAEIALLVTTKAGAPAAEHAHGAAVEHLFLDPAVLDPAGIDREMCTALLQRRIDLVVLAGYLRKIGPRTLEAFAGRILNTHPGPLPGFGGRGMHGERVHQAVLDAGLHTTLRPFT